MGKNDCTIICLTPVKNEEWIIERFLLCTSLWADVIILSDQGSTDQTVTIAKRFEKVRLIDNSKLKDFNEKQMRAPLFEEARKISGKKLLISLDADEIFTPNFDSLEWDTLTSAAPGTRFIFNWYHLQPNFKSYFTTFENPCAFIDDDSEYDVGVIHVPRIPLPRNVKYIKLNEISILHFQFTNWERMERKHIWYRMYEKIVNPRLSTIAIWRRFHYTYDKPIDNITVYPLPMEWIKGYSSLNINITSVNILPVYYWDSKVVRYLTEHKSSFFKRIDLGTFDWTNIGLQLGIPIENIHIPHNNWIDKLIVMYLRRTQLYKETILVKVIDKILSTIF